MTADALERTKKPLIFKNYILPDWVLAEREESIYERVSRLEDEVATLRNGYHKSNYKKQHSKIRAQVD